MTRSERVKARRERASASGKCDRCCLRDREPGLKRCAFCREDQARYRAKKAGRPYVPLAAAKPRRRVIRRLVVTGESRIELCLREARELVARKLGFWGSYAYDGYQSALRRRYDEAVNKEFIRRLKTAGIAVEGA